ncbi:MAG: hypothetical protein ACOYXA_13785 [Bacteroidota bacterium]
MNCWRKALRWMVGLVISLGLALGLLVAPIDRTPLQEQDFYQTMAQRLDTLQLSQTAAGKLSVDWGVVNITPGYSMPMAGYRPRNGFDAVHDSLFARILLVDNGHAKALLVNVDLLLFPTALKERLQQKLAAAGWKEYFLYPSATHTHNAVGGWDESTGGQWVLGKFDEGWLEGIANAIAEKVVQLAPRACTMQPWYADASEWVENRLALDKGAKDGLIRGFTMEREDKKRALFFTYSAHATSISKKSRVLSADYPAAVFERLQNEFDFGMYMAGMVGSHRFIWAPEMDFEWVAKAGDVLHNKIKERTSLISRDSVEMEYAEIPIVFGPSQLRIGKNWKLRDWVFSSLFQPLEGNLSVLRIGNVWLVGTPCDFSGEIYVESSMNELLQDETKLLIITSFNGHYNGYITHDAHYDQFRKEEVRSMNWVGPYYGAYFAWMIGEVLSKESVDNK